MCPSLIQIGSKTAEQKLCTNKQTNKQTNRHYENNGHLAVNQFICSHFCKLYSYNIDIFNTDSNTAAETIRLIHHVNFRCRLKLKSSKHITNSARQPYRSSSYRMRVRNRMQRVQLTVGKNASSRISIDCTCD